MKDFETFLQQRVIVPPSRNLTARIVAAAMNGANAVQSISISQWLNELFADFMLPKPAYAFSSFLVVGFVVGFVVAPIMASQEVSANPQMILTDEGDLP